MSNYNSLKTTINANVKQNGVQAITGQILNSVLNAMVTTLGTGYQFAGVATTATDPGSPDAKVFYIANGKGTYTNFGGVEVTEDDVVVLYWDSSWHKVSTGIASQAKLSELGSKVGNVTNIAEEGPASFPMEIIGGRTYKIVNKRANSSVLAVRQTPSGTSTDVVTLLANGTLLYTPQNSGHYLYHNTVVDLTIADTSSLSYKVEDVGNSIDGLKSDIGRNLSKSSSGVGSLFYDYPLKKGVTYTIKNKGTSGTINVMSASEASSGHVVETFKNGLAIGASLDFTPSVDAPYLQIYFVAIGAFEIDEKNSIKLRTANLEGRMNDAEINIATISSSLQGTVKQADIKPLLVDSKLNYSVLHGNVVNATDGSLSPSTGISYVIIDISNANLLKISYKQTTFGGNYGYGFFTTENQWVGGVHTTSVKDVDIVVPANAREFRCCWNAGLVSDAIQEIKGTSIANIQKVKAESVKDNLSFPFYPDFDLSKTPVQTTVPYASTMNEFYSMYDELVTLYPNWVSKIDCDAEVGFTKPDYLSGLPIYMYKFSPKRTSTLADSGSRIKMLIVSGLHSNEVMGMYVLNRFFTMLGNHWKNDKNVEQMRTLIDFYVIPCLNPWGFVNRSNTGERGVRIPGRANGNGVNLNRNFPTGDWKTQGSPTDADSNYSGASAGSEYETKVLMHYVETIQPDACFDVHTGGMTTNGAYGSVEIHDGADWRLVSMLIGMGRAICNQWVKDNTNFPQDMETASRIFDVNLSTVAGEFHRWAYEQGIDLSVLTEESIFQNWVDGVLQTTNQEYNTDRIWRENLQAVYNTIMRVLYAASLTKLL